MHAIGYVLSSQIKCEILKCKYVAIIIDETFDNANITQLSIMNRYLKKNRIKEIYKLFKDFKNETMHDIIK